MENVNTREGEEEGHVITLSEAGEILHASYATVLRLGTDGVLSASFDQMLRSAGTVTMRDVVHGVWEAAILPIGCGVLSLTFILQLIRISQRMDGNASMPGVKEVVFLLVFYAVFLFVLQHSFELMQSVYEVSRIAVSRVSDLFGTGSALDLQTVSITTTDDDVAALLGMLVVALVKSGGWARDVMGG
ncbi:hypothetical protein [Olsenella uli]|uniref:hypothetical protein n=1 Tax=Olsenella uli TaxID=133926 RepID=UPI0024A8B7C6|nr:hypothetical protein [Olsenella uli]